MRSRQKRLAAFGILLAQGLALPSWGSLYAREKPSWQGNLSASLETLDQKRFGSASPSFNSLSLEGGLPGKFSLGANLEAGLYADLGQNLKQARVAVSHGHGSIRRGSWELKMGRIFISAGIPSGFQDGASLEGRVLRKFGVRIFGGRPAWESGPFGRGRSWGGGLFHRGKAWGGALNADVGYHINSGQARVWTGAEEELLPYIRREVLGGVLSWSRHGIGGSSIVNYDLLYRRFNEAMVAVHRRTRSGTTFRLEGRLRGSVLPGDSIFVVFAGAGRTWWEGAGGADLALGRFLLRADAGWSPDLGRYWGEAGIQSRVGSLGFRGAGSAPRASWALAFKRETGPGSQAHRLKPRFELQFARGLVFSAYGSAGGRQLPGRPKAGILNLWAAGGSLSRRFGAAEAMIHVELQAWLDSKPDRRAGLQFSAPLGAAFEPRKKP